jgi:hypothetical protein
MKNVIFVEKEIGNERNLDIMATITLESHSENGI